MNNNSINLNIFLCKNTQKVKLQHVGVEFEYLSEIWAHLNYPGCHFRWRQIDLYDKTQSADKATVYHSCLIWETCILFG